MKVWYLIGLCRHAPLCRVSQEDTQKKISVDIFWERVHNPASLHNDEWMIGIEELVRAAPYPGASGQGLGRRMVGIGVGSSSF